MDKFRKVAIDAAYSAGELLKKRLGEKRKIDYKGAIDLVTDADRDAEAIIVKKIKANFPEHQIYAEEGLKQKAQNNAFRWLIDPLDGTTNFAHNFPYFCVSIALEKKNDLLIGVVYDPVRDELFFAQKGKGAYLNNKKIRTSDIKYLKRALLCTGFPYDIKTATEDNIRNFKNFLGLAQAVRRTGAAALDLCYVACGRFDGFWEMKLNPWDVAAAKLIVEEAGGKVTLFNGSKFRYEVKQMLATNGRLHSEMVNVFKKSGY